MSDTITIVGVIGTDPEKKTWNGTAITTFRVASKDRRFDRATGAWVDGETNWYTVSAYRRLAEHAFDSLHRRDRVILTGRLRVRNWDSGDKRGTSVDIDVDAIGHELLFGTTTFAQDAATGTSAQTSASEDAWAPVDGQSAGWDTAPLGSGTDRAQEPTGSTPESAEGSQSAEGEHKRLALAGVETPF
jgi:single-strand DNA-binding protein